PHGRSCGEAIKGSLRGSGGGVSAIHRGGEAESDCCWRPACDRHRAARVTTCGQP
ncbi:unnamed protein product, partial [Closterium sp. NIES-53]